MKGWGKLRIVRGLKENKISDYCINKAIQSELPEKEYKEKLYQILKKKAVLLKDQNIYIRNQKLVRHALYKGYESNIIWEMLENYSY